jgi:hypothetical protein
MKIHSVVFVDILSMSRKFDFFPEKATMTLWLNVQHNGTAINLPVSPAERTFGSGHPQRIY